MNNKAYIDASVVINDAGNQFFDFNKNKVQTLSIEQLERTNREHDVNNNPLMGILNYQV